MILKTIISTVADLTPLIGSVRDNLASKDGGVGRLVKPRFIKSCIRLILALAACWMLAKGTISADEFQELTK